MPALVAEGAQQERLLLAAKPDGLSGNPRVHMVGRKTWHPTNCPVTFTCASWWLCTCEHTHTRMHARAHTHPCTQNVIKKLKNLTSQIWLPILGLLCLLFSKNHYLTLNKNYIYIYTYIHTHTDMFSRREVETDYSSEKLCQDRYSMTVIDSPTGLWKERTSF